MAAPRLLRAFMTVGGWTMASRILGFVRDIMIAATLGAGPVAEAFLIAFSLPNMFRRFFAEGAFNMAFIPMFSKKVEGKEDALSFARDAFSGLAFVVLIFTILAQIFMPALVLAMASGFLADDRFDLAVLYGRIAFPYILFISLAALLSGVLNATHRFVAAAAAPVLLNIIFIAAMGAAMAMGWNVGDALAWTVPIAGVAQLVLVWIAASRAGYRLIPRRPHMTPELKRLAIIAAPAALAGGVVQVNLLIGRQVASFFDGAIAWLNYADRLYQLPLGVVGIAIGVVLLPDLSRRLRAGDVDGGREALSRAGELSLALTIPASVALIVIPGPLIETLFQRGAFNADDTAKTAIAVAVYGMGLPAFVLQKVLQPIFFARENTKTPFYYALVALVVNAGLAIGLSYVFGYIAAAIGTTVAGWTMTLMLWRGSWKMGEEARFDGRFWSRFWRIVAASWLMGAVLYGSVILIGPMFGGGGSKYLALTILITLGITSYFGIGSLLGAFRIREFRAAMRRG
ncbi:murein biosynthesis integral membrane protein MurJ [Aliiroseovarius subalbicans]|uniref:murein biosynthesis integral membrane protein MurJ n=1 Tax=Aliiroseovarius subalbicans TaxID=2925840 RepID=UPI001F57973A|nr:murein biosynthesis integral membrane protein MurJ [Aliiroseovarius subalbicans]MCI2399397.1 murein biosynthesis integral membrane protein MurJ [Aliiroseovarius subalbicans]